MFLSELLEDKLWWKGLSWLRLMPAHWPYKQSVSAIELLSEQERDICFITTTQSDSPIVPLDKYSTFVHPQRVTAWYLQFIKNCPLAKGTRLDSATAVGCPHLIT